MNFSFPKTDSPALDDGRTRLSFRELAAESAGRAAVSGPTGKLLVLEAGPTCSFVVNLLAALEREVPVAIVAAGYAVGTLPVPAARCALVLASGGSTGRPKFVQLSADALAENTRLVRESLSFDSARRQFLFLPLHHSFGLLSQLLPALCAGMETVLVPGFARMKYAAASAAFGGMLSGTPPQLSALERFLEADAAARDAVTHLVSAGGPLSVAQRRSLQRSFPRARITNNYGLTELASRVSSLGNRDPKFLEPGCAGRLLPGIEARVSSGGRLHLRSGKAMLGYLGEPIRAAEDWLDTLDLARLDADGYLYLLGRADQQLKVNGILTPLAQVEEQLQRLAAEPRLRLFPEGAGVVVLLPDAERPVAAARIARAQLEAQGLAVSVREYQEAKLAEAGKLTPEVVASARPLEE